MYHTNPCPCPDRFTGVPAVAGNGSYTMEYRVLQYTVHMQAY